MTTKHLDPTDLAILAQMDPAQLSSEDVTPEEVLALYRHYTERLNDVRDVMCAKEKGAIIEGQIRGKRGLRFR